jgi:peptidyl-prolyl cis-trans isomerase D
VDLLLAVEELKDLVFNAEDLNQPAQEMGLTISRSGPVMRDQVEGLFANQSLLTAAFSEEVMEAGHNSDVIELGDNRFVVLRQHSYSPSQPMELEEVRDEIAVIITEQSAREMVSAEANRILHCIIRSLVGGPRVCTLCASFT